MTPDGDVAVVWHRAANQGSTSDTVLSRRDATTGAWTSPDTLLTGIDDSTPSGRFPDGLVLAPNGDAAVSWRDDGHDRRVFRCTLGSPCAELGDPVVDHDWGALFAASTDGSVAAGWKSDQVGSARVRVTTWEPTDGLR